MYELLVIVISPPFMYRVSPMSQCTRQQWKLQRKRKGRLSWEPVPVWPMLWETLTSARPSSLRGKVPYYFYYIYIAPSLRRLCM